MKNRKAAMEYSIGTIVVIVLAVTLLVFGMIFVKKVMCSGIIITDKISTSMENELKNLFDANEYGVVCMGEEGRDVKIGDGGRRQIICIFNVDTEAEYNLKVNSVESLKGVSTNSVQDWVLDQGWKGRVAPGQKTVTVLLLDIPRQVSSTSLKIEIEEENLDTGVRQTHQLHIDVFHVGSLSSAIC